MHVCMYMCVCFHTQNSSSIYQRVPDYYPNPKEVPSLSQEREREREKGLSGYPLPPNFQ